MNVRLSRLVHAGLLIAYKVCKVPMPSIYPANNAIDNHPPCCGVVHARARWLVAETVSAPVQHRPQPQISCRGLTISSRPNVTFGFAPSLHKRRIFVFQTPLNNNYEERPFLSSATV
jgi:hypothetical protein